MNNVDAVRTKEEIEQIEQLLTKHGNADFSDIWKLGINVAFRISDLLSLEFNNINTAKRELIIKEGKTGKKRTVRLNETALSIVLYRRALYPNDVYLFQSHSNRGKGVIQPLSRQAVARKFKEIGDIIGVQLSTHSMRKTRGYAMHIAGVKIEQIARVLNHSSPAVTMDYIGLTHEATQQTYDEFEL